MFSMPLRHDTDTLPCATPRKSKKGTDLAVGRTRHWLRGPSTARLGTVDTARRVQSKSIVAISTGRARWYAGDSP